MPGVKSDPFFRLERVSNLYPMRPDLDKMTADWKRPRKSPSHFSVEDRVFSHASDLNGRQAARVVLWLTIVQPDAFFHSAPTYDFLIKQPNVDDQSFIHGGKSDRS